MPLFRKRPAREVRWTEETVRAQLLAGESPRLHGGADGHAHWPLAEATEPSDFQHRTARRARHIIHDIEAAAHRDIAALMEAGREDPTAIDATRMADEAGRAPDAFIEAASARLTPEVAPLTRAAERVETADLTFRHDLQTAGAQRPRGGWARGAWFLPVLALTFGAETAIAAATLQIHLGWPQAAMQGAGMSFVSIALGACASFLALRPARHTDVGGPFRIARLTGAVLCGVLLLAMIYAMAANRAALFDGQDATGQEILQAMADPKTLLLHWEAWVLAILSLAGFGVAAWEVHHYFHGHVPALRASGRTAERAAAERQALRETLVAWTSAEAEAAQGRLDDLALSADAWFRACARRADEADAVLREARRRVVLTDSALRAVWAEYHVGNLEVRHRAAGRPAVLAPPTAEATLPDVTAFAEARDAARDQAEALTPLVRAAQVDVGRRRDFTIDHIDVLAGLRPPPPPLAPPPGAPVGPAMVGAAQ